MRTNTVLVILSILASSKVSGDCPAGWIFNPVTNSCYHVSRDPETWGEAMKMCEIHEGTLVHIETLGEQQFLEQILQQGTQNYYWLGGSDWSMQNSWVWEPNGEAITFTNWAPREPNNGGSDKVVGQDCMVMIRNDGFKWHDHKCDPHDYWYICERSAN